MDFKPLDAFLDSLLDRGYPMYDTTIHIAGQEVYRRRGWAAVHHLEILTRREG